LRIWKQAVVRGLIRSFSITDSASAAHVPFDVSARSCSALFPLGSEMSVRLSREMV
jgi:hypothetical protein